MSTAANKSIWAIMIGAAFTVAMSFLPDLMPLDVWNTLQAATVAAAVWFIPNKA